MVRPFDIAAPAVVVAAAFLDIPLSVVGVTG